MVLGQQQITVQHNKQLPPFVHLVKFPHHKDFATLVWEEHYQITKRETVSTQPLHSVVMMKLLLLRIPVSHAKLDQHQTQPRNTAFGHCNNVQVADQMRFLHTPIHATNVKVVPIQTQL